MASEDDKQEPAGETHGEEGVRRRDFLNIAAVSVAGVGGAVVLLPLINQMNPSADVLALSSIDVDLSPIEEGQAIKTVWRKQPVFIKHLTAAEITEVEATNVSSLRDPQSFDERTHEGHRQWYISLAVCTHLGCIPLGSAEGENKGEYDGFFCPCHGSHYDAVGRIMKGPAPENLAIPEYEFTSDTSVTIG